MTDIKYSQESSKRLFMLCLEEMVKRIKIEADLAALTAENECLKLGLGELKEMLMITRREEK
jgi:hypothetical protein